GGSAKSRAALLFPTTRHPESRTALLLPVTAHGQGRQAPPRSRNRPARHSSEPPDAPYREGESVPVPGCPWAPLPDRVPRGAAAVDALLRIRDEEGDTPLRRPRGWRRRRSTGPPRAGPDCLLHY